MNVTIITHGKLSMEARNGETTINVDVSGSGKVQKYFTSKPYSLETNGAVVEAYGPAGLTLEILGIEEFRDRFPEEVSAHPKLATAAGFCQLAQASGGAYYCKQGSCTGSCKLKNFPVYCACE